MNYYAARELMDKSGKGIGKWHYTCMNDGVIWPVGYCSGMVTCPDCNGDSSPWSFSEDKKDCARCANKGSAQSENPCPGHDSAKEACNHYKQYLLDHAEMRGPKTQEWPKEKCSVEGCNSEATHLGHVDWTKQYELCEAHATKEVLATLFEVGECWSSY